MSDEIVLEVRNLHTYFFLRRGVVKAVDGLSFSLRRGEVLGLVGESGCGKSVTALSLLRLLPQAAARTVEGEVLLEGENLLTTSPREMRQIRGRKIAMILQDPHTSLNPVFTMGNQLREPPRRTSPRVLVAGSHGRDYGGGLRTGIDRGRSGAVALSRRLAAEARPGEWRGPCAGAVAAVRRPAGFPCWGSPWPRITVSRATR